MNTNFRTKRKHRNEEDDEDVTPQMDKHLGYFTRTKVATCITVPIDEGVREAVYYRQVAKAISEAGPDDQVEFEISSPGGYLNGLIALLTAMAKTEATTVAHINGECHSAASLLALNCDAIYVSPYATMLVHFVQFGASGKGTDVKSHVDHIYNTSEKLFRNTYKYFLTDQEIEKCIQGLELWLDADEINERLKRKFEILQKEAKKANSKSNKNKNLPSDVV